MEGEGESEVKEERGRGEDRMKGPSGQGSRHSNTGSRRGYSHLGQREPTGVCNCACVCVHSRADSDHLEQTASGASASASAHARVCVPARCVRPVFGASEAERHVEYVASALSVSVEAYEAPSDQCWFFQVTAFWLAEERPSFLFSSLPLFLQSLHSKSTRISGFCLSTTVTSSFIWPTSYILPRSSKILHQPISFLIVLCGNVTLSYSPPPVINSSLINLNFSLFSIGSCSKTVSNVLEHNSKLQLTMKKLTSRSLQQRSRPNSLPHTELSLGCPAASS